MSFTIELRQGTTLIASRTPALTSSLTTYEFELTAPERALITNWSTLRYHFIGNTDQTQVTWAEFAVPASGVIGQTTGRGTATGVSASYLSAQSAVGNAAGASTATGGAQYKGTATGLGTALGVGRSFIVSTALSIGTSSGTAPSTGGTVSAGIANASGWCQVFGNPELQAVQGINTRIATAAGAATVEGSSLTGNHMYINGVEFGYLIEGFSIEETYHGQNTLQCVIQYPTLPERTPFERGDEIIVTENGTRIFGGFLDSVVAHGIGGEVPNAVEYTIVASDYEVLAEYRFVIDGGFPAGFPLKTAFYNTGAYLFPYGVYIDPDQVTGPTLPLLLYDIRSIRAIWDEFSDITGYIWSIDYYKQAAMRVPGAIQAPFNVGYSQTAFAGPPHRFLIQQAEYYNRLQEGDPRLLIEMWASTLAAYNSYHNLYISPALGDIIIAMPADERAAFDTAFLIEYNSGRFIGEDLNFLIYQAEFYSYLPENDPRLLTWFYPATLAAYEALIAAHAASWMTIINSVMIPSEREYFYAAYNTATISGRIATTDHLGDVEVEPAKIDYANRVIVRFGTGAKEIEDTLGGPTDGTQTAFPLLYTNLIAHRGYVHITEPGIGAYNETLSIGGGGTWDYDPVTNIVTRLVAPLAGSEIIFTYTSQFPQSAIATAWGQLEDRPLKEVVLPYPDIFSLGTAIAVAEAWLPRYVAQPRSAHYMTRRGGIHPGMLQVVTVPSRHFDHTCFVSDVTITATEYGFVRQVSVMEGALLQGSWRDLYRLWGGSGGGGGGGGGGGLVLTTPPPTVGVGVTGSGTIDSLSKWTATMVLGDSGLTANAGALTSGSTGAGFTIALSTSTVTGTLEDARLSSNVPLKNAENVFTKTNHFQGLAGTEAIRVRGRTADDTGVLAWYAANDSTLQGKITGNMTSLTVVATGDLLLQPGGNITVDPAGNTVLPAVNYDVSLGRLDRKYLMLHCAELWVETLVAQNTIATIGGRILVGPTTTLAADLSASANTISVKHGQMVNGDIAYLEGTAAAGQAQVEFMKITSGPSGTGPYTYSVTRNLDNTTPNDWLAGDAVFNTGRTGNGFIDIYSVRGVRSGTEYGPTIVGNVPTAHAAPPTDYFNAWEPRWMIGNLNGHYGYSTDIYGAAFGKWAGLAVTIDADFGFWIGYNGQDRFFADTSGNLTLAGNLTVGLAGIIRTAGATSLTEGTGIYMAGGEGGTTPVFRVGDPAIGSGKHVTWDGDSLNVGMFEFDGLNMLSDKVTVNASGLLTVGNNNTNDFIVSSIDVAYRFWVGSVAAPTLAIFSVSSSGGMLCSGLQNLGGESRYAIVYPTQITANQNNYNPGYGRIFRISTDATRNITGILAGGRGSMLLLTNGGSFNISLTHEDTNSTAENRFVCPGATTFILHIGDSVEMYYDDLVDRWILIAAV